MDGMNLLRAMGQIDTGLLKETGKNRHKVVFLTHIGSVLRAAAAIMIGTAAIGMLISMWRGKTGDPEKKFTAETIGFQDENAEAFAKKDTAPSLEKRIEKNPQKAEEPAQNEINESRNPRITDQTSEGSMNHSNETVRTEEGKPERTKDMDQPEKKKSVNPKELARIKEEKAKIRDEMNRTKGEKSSGQKENIKQEDDWSKNPEEMTAKEDEGPRDAEDVIQYAIDETKGMADEGQNDDGIHPDAAGYQMAGQVPGQPDPDRYAENRQSENLDPNADIEFMSPVQTDPEVYAQNQNQQPEQSQPAVYAADKQPDQSVPKAGKQDDDSGQSNSNVYASDNPNGQADPGTYASDYPPEQPVTDVYVADGPPKEQPFPEVQAGICPQPYETQTTEAVPEVTQIIQEQEVLQE